MFAVMVILWCLALQTLHNPARYGSLYRSFIVVGIVGLAYGVAMEFVQLYFVAHRSFDSGDIIADAAGCLAGWLYCTRRYIKK